MGRFVSKPLVTQLEDFDQIREFLGTCRYVSDEEQFGKEDYWMPPEQFEQTRRGDCDDFALWTWRQLLGIGLDARFVVGKTGRYGDGHAWVTYKTGERYYLVEPLSSAIGESLPKLSAIRYQPSFSVGWNGEKLLYFIHEERRWRPTLSEVLPLVGEWLFFWTRTCAKALAFIPLALMRTLRRVRRS